MSVVVALVPVLLLLLLLQLLDSFRLVRLGAVLTAIAAGALAAFACLFLHGWVFAVVNPDINTFMRYVAPITEETGKAAYIAVLLARSRIGFLVDAAVQGFAVGAGFALVENADYLRHLGDASVGLWLVRGLGTGVLHAATAAVFALVAKTMSDRTGALSFRALAPAWLLAVVIHSAFNHLPLPPLAMTAVLLLVLPLVVLAVFQRSEHVTRDWLGAGLDLDLELLELVRSEQFAYTRFGEYLHELRGRFGGKVAADMFCLLRLELELSVQAKAMLMAREAGLTVPATEDLRISLRELEFLQSSIGRMGLLALKPLQVTTGRDRWLRHLMAVSSGG